MGDFCRIIFSLNTAFFLLYLLLRGIFYTKLTVPKLQKTSGLKIDEAKKTVELKLKGSTAAAGAD